MAAWDLISSEERKFFDKAAADTRLRIRNDQAKCSPRVKNFLRYLEKEIYRKKLDVKRWKAECSIRGNSIETQFRYDLGSTMHQYLSSRRLETAAQLLLRPQPNLTKIAELIGYKSLAVFSRAFERSMGMRPSHYRALEGSEDPVTTPRQRSSRWRRVLLSPDDPPSFKERRRLFAELFPRERTCGDNFSYLSFEKIEMRQAKRIWSRIKDRSNLEQIALVRLQADFKTTALFDLLREKSREEGRRDRRRGIEVAELALHSLTSCARALGEAVPNHQALGWIALANARRLVLDFIGAERDFEFAESLWREAKKPDPLVEAELLLYKGALRWFQMSSEKALKLTNRAVEILETIHKQTLFAQALILQSAIQFHLGRFSQTVLVIEKVLTVINKADHPYLSASAYTTYAAAQIQLGNYRMAEKATQQAKILCQRLDYEVGLLHISWVEGLRKQAQCCENFGKKYFERALSGFIRVDEVGQAALVRLDLAISCKLDNENEHVIELASQTIPILERLKYRQEVLVVLKIFAEALTDRVVSLHTLRTARSVVSELLRDPLACVAFRRKEAEGHGG